MHWKTLLGYITGSVDQERLLRNEYLVAENRILRQQIKGCVPLSDGECKILAEIGKKLGRQALKEVATIVKPDTILTWHRKLGAHKFDGSQQRKRPGRPTVHAELETLVVGLAEENRTWGYDRIVGALKHRGYRISDQTVGNMLKNVTAFPQFHTVSRRRPGRNLSAPTWMCSSPRISSRRRSGRSMAW